MGKPGHRGVFSINSLASSILLTSTKSGIDLLILNVDQNLSKIVAAFQRLAERDIVSKEKSFRFRSQQRNGRFLGSKLPVSIFHCLGKLSDMLRRRAAAAAYDLAPAARRDSIFSANSAGREGIYGGILLGGLPGVRLGDQGYLSVGHRSLQQFLHHFGAGGAI